MFEVQPVTGGVYVLVGHKEQRSAENLADNATFGVVVTADTYDYLEQKNLISKRPNGPQWQ